MGSKNKARLELTEQQRAEVRQAFDLFDTDGQGMPAASSMHWISLGKTVASHPSRRHRCERAQGRVARPRI